MDWIKKNPHQLALAVLSVGLIGASASVLLNAKNFPEKFEAAQQSPIPNNNIDPLELGPMQSAQQKITKPAQWSLATANNGSLIVPERYIIDNGTPKLLREGGQLDRLTRAVIPNQWFLENRLGNPLNPQIVAQDPDGDGFWNDDEWRGKTDPNDKASHPPFYTKLFLKQFIRVPFRLRFDSYDEGDPKKKIAPTFQINTLDLRQPTEFLEIGKKVPRTPFKLDSFQKKEAENPSTGEKSDVSELTLVNTETNDKVVLVLQRTTDSPDSFALFAYLYPPASEFKVKKLGEFALRPNTSERYKVLDIQETQAVIQLPSGEKYTVPRLPPNYP